MGNPILAGRPLTWKDTFDITPVAVVTENFALEYWDAAEEAIGKRIRQDPDEIWREIVGVVGNIHDNGVTEGATATIFWPMLHHDFWGDKIFTRRTLGYAIRSPRANAPGFLDEIRSQVWSVNRNLPLANVYTLQEFLDNSMARTAFALVMLAIASTVALLLGAIGIYGVISYAVSQRTREIGVRMARGARRADVSRLVLRDGLFLTACGLAVGIVAALLLTQWMSTLLHGVSAVDPVTYLSVSVVLAGVALLACYLPARRASSVAPTEALRWE